MGRDEHTLLTAVVLLLDPDASNDELGEAWTNTFLLDHPLSKRISGLLDKRMNEDAR